MKPENSTALKEWASVCAALATGRQTLLIRKGGIAEGDRGFQLDRPEFWLYPTQFHQDSSQLTAEGAQLLATLKPPAAGRVVIDLYAVVEHVAFLSDLDALESLADLHVLSPESVRKRFEYRRPGVFAAAVKVFRKAAPVELTEEPRFAGCRSWVELNEALLTAGLRPVVEESRIAETVNRLQAIALWD
jgi:hypothetical protein